MAEVTSNMIKELRDKTQAGMVDCKKALVENDGDMDKAVEYLRKKGLASADKKMGREVTEGIVASYIHSNSKIGVLVELKCATDFVARNEEFVALAKEIAMQITAMVPVSVNRESCPQEVIDKEMHIYREQIRMEGKPEDMVEKIALGKLNKFFKEFTLEDQIFVKEGKITVKEYLKTVDPQVKVTGFYRYSLND